MRSSWSLQTRVGLASALVLLAVQCYAQEAGPATAAGAPAAADTGTPAAVNTEASAVNTASAAAAGASAPAQRQPQAQADEEVVVRGQRMSEIEFNIRDYITDFVDQVAAPPMGRGYARWNSSVCIGVHNLERSAAQYIVDRIARLALEVDLEPEEPGCDPDIMIIFTTDAQELARYLVDNEPRLFRPGGGVCCMQLGLEALEDFANSDRIVRWWHVSMPVDTKTGARAIRLPHDDTYPVIAVDGPSRIHSGIIDDMYRVIIIVDGARLGNKTWQQIGDYLAVVSLAQIDPKADPTEFDSILNLFTNPGAYSGLTDWDLFYMHALYSISQEQNPRMQVNQVVDKMAKQERASFE